MIVFNSKDGSMGVPLKGFESSRFVDLPPGYTEVADEDWALARDYVLDAIASGVLKEEWKKVDKIEATKYAISIESEDARESAKVRVPAKLTDIERKGSRLSEIISNTYNIPILKAWMDSDTRQDIIVEIQKQLTGIDNGTIKG
jgi:hypothetical protein